MKKIFTNPIILILGCLVQIEVNGSVVFWDGGANDSQWSSSLNWLGDVVPGSADDVIFDNSVLNTTYNVLLPAGAVTVSVNSITISPSGNNSITLILPTSNTANPGLSVTGTGHAFILNNNAVFKNSSGAGSGSGLLVTNNLRINNGGRYVHNTSRGNATIVSQLANVAGTELGVFEFDVPVASYVLSLSGRTFGCLVLSSAANGGTTSYSGSGASMLNINGNLQVNSGVSFSTSMSAMILIKGDLNQASASTFNLQSSSNNNIVQVKGNLNCHGTITETNTGLPVLELNGIANQDLNVTGLTVNNSVDLRLNNSAGATLLSNIILPYRYSVQAGNMTLGNFTLATPLINQISAATQTSNHVITNGTGVLKITGVNSNVVFPIGFSSDSYNPVTIVNGGGSDYSVRVENAINPSIAFPTYGINRTWNINASVNTGGVGLRFQYASADANAGASQPQDMEFLMNSNNVWNIIPGNNNITPTGADPAWTLSTVTPLTINNTPTPFALGVDGGWILPIRNNPVIPVFRSIQKLEFKICPQPVTGNAMIAVQSPKKMQADLLVIDIQGVRLMKWQASVNKGVSFLPFNTTGLRNGYYLLIIMTSEETRVLKFLKR